MATDNWRTMTIGSLIDEGVITVHKDGNHGSNYPRTDEFGNEGVPFLTAKLLDDAGNIDLDSAPRLAYEKAGKFKFGFIETDDVLLSHNATVGRVAVVPTLPERVLIGTSLTHFRLDKSKLLPRYLAAYFSGREFQNQLASVMSQTTRNQVPITSQRNLSIVIPPVPEQARIAKILGSFDDKIDLNRHINQTLEQIAQAIFKSWFVDFDPVNAKIEAKSAGCDPERAAMCAISGKLEPELDQLPPEQYQQLVAIAALFPDELVESELGLIPLGWEVKSLDEVTCYLNRGISPKYTEDGGVLVLNQKCIRDNIVDVSKARRHDVSQRKIDGRELLVGDVLVNSTGVGTLGRVAQVLDLSELTIVDSHVTVVRAKRPATWNYLGLALLRRQDEIEQLGEGSTGQTELNRGKLAGLFLTVPSLDVLQAFDAIILPLRQQFSANFQQAETLVTLRDTLLTKLLSGEIALNDPLV